MTESIISTKQGHVLHLQLNRPDAHNAINGEIMNGLIDTAKSLRDPGDVRVIVLSGIGKSFCSGLDMAYFGEMAAGNLSAETASDAFADISPAGANFAQQIGWLWQEIPIPVIAALHGAVLGGGLNLALGADIRLAAPDAKVGFVEIGWGTIPDMSATQSLRHLLRLDVMKEIVMTGRKFSGEEAVNYGLATKVEQDPLQAAMDMARSIARSNPDAIRAAKHIFNAIPHLSESEGLALEADYSAKILGSDNMNEAILASMENREANFSSS